MTSVEQHDQPEASLTVNSTIPMAHVPLFPAPVLPNIPDTRRLLLARVCLYVAERKLHADIDAWHHQFMQTLFQYLKLTDPAVQKAVAQIAWDDIEEEDIDEMIYRVFDTAACEQPPPLPPRRPPVLPGYHITSLEEQGSVPPPLPPRQPTLHASQTPHDIPASSFLDVKQAVDKAKLEDIIATSSDVEIAEAVEEVTSILQAHSIFDVENLSLREAVMLELILLSIGLVKTMKDAEHVNSTSDTSSDTKNKAELVSLEDQLMPGEYDARSRAVLYYIAERINLPGSHMRALEQWIARRLYFSRESALAQEQDMSDTGSPTTATESAPRLMVLAQALHKVRKLRNKRGRLRRWAATGTSVVVGAVALGLTGGLAAPMLLVGMGVLGLGWATTLITTGGIMLVTSLFGLTGGGLAGYRMARRTGGLNEFAFIPVNACPELPIIPSLHATIVISGYLKPKMSADEPWRTACAVHLDDRDVYALAFDTEILQDLGRAFREFLATEAADYIMGEILERTILAAVLTPLSIPMNLMKLASIIDNPWAMAMDRARKAGRALADVLEARVQGRRPVSLIGYSVGALVVFKCLQSLAERKCYGLVDTAVLLGAPVSTDETQWQQIRSVVSGRLINGYAKSDWVLAFLFRVHDRKLKPAGLQPVNVPSVESIDLSHIIKGHLSYRKEMEAVLEAIQIS